MGRTGLLIVALLAACESGSEGDGGDADSDTDSDSDSGTGTGTETATGTGTRSDTGTAGAFGETCAKDSDCASNVCHTFGQGGPLCTMACSSADECPEGSRGRYCNDQGVCRP